MKVVFHFNEKDKFKMVNLNVNNLLEQDNNIEVVVVINGPAVELYTDQTIKLRQGVKYFICNEAITQRNVDKDKLIEGLKIVESAVYEIARLQSVGYSYIRP